MGNFILLLLCLPLMMNSCKNNSEIDRSELEVSNNSFEKLNELQWLLGTWINKTDGKFSKENWIKDNDSTFSAFSYTEVGKDTVFAETMLLQQKEGNLFLTAAEADEENRTIVTFKLIPSEKGQFIFENKEHDFPERIIYTNPSKDSISAWIEGTINGEKKTIYFPFSREK